MKHRLRMVMTLLWGVTSWTAPAAVRYVWKDNPNTAVFPYTSGWAGAATNIQDAADAAADGDTVLVTNGVYDAGARVAPGDTTLKTRLVITNAVMVVSVSGPEQTLIVGQPHTAMTYDGLGDGAVRGVYLANGSVLSGFTVTNGFTRYTSSTAAKHFYGGGICCESAAARVTNCVIAGNLAALRGGGIFQGTVVDCHVLTNAVRASSASAGGGGLYGATVLRSLVENNRTAGTSTDGGGAYGCTLDGCTLRGNSAGRDGGGAYLCALVSCTVESNSALQAGGGAHTPVIVTNSLIRWNTAGRHGGGLYKGTVADSVIASNTVTAANYYGGGYYGATAADDRLLNCEVVANSAVTYGGGVYNAVMSNCVVRANRAVGNSATTGNGGGYYASSATGYQVANTRFLDNQANYRGGGAYQGKFYSCVFSGNTASQGGGAYLASTGYQLNSCTVMGNSATNQYGGTYSGTIKNSIISCNEAPSSPNWNSGAITYSCTDPLPSGAGNTNVNPLVSGYCAPHLLPDSPLLGCGLTEAWMTDASDLDGETRMADGKTDMGADQFHGEALEGPLSVSLVTVTNTCAVGWPHAFRFEAEGKVERVNWNFGDGVAAEGVNPAEHAFAVPGVYTVGVTVSNATHMAHATFEITVVAYVCHVSPCGGHTAPFDTWEKAATNIQEAVDAVALPGGRVLVTNGVYETSGRAAAGQSVTNRVALDKAVRVESVNGPEGTVIRGRWHSESAPLGVSAIRGVYVGGEAVLCGFTVQGGATAETASGNNGRGGGLFLAAGGMATNCAITGCSAWSGGGAASEPGAAGVLRSCTLTGNQALTAGFTSGQGGGASLIELVGCALSSNSAYTGGGSYDCNQEACELNGNTADYQGGGAYYGVLNRCRVRDNGAGTPSSGAGGGVFDATLFSCLISGNTARQGGGVYGATAAKGMYNCTVFGNGATVTGSTQGGGGFYGGSSTYPVRNCIVYYNSALLSPNLFQGSVDHTCSAPVPAGTENIGDEPMLSSFNRGLLLPGSPCVGAGLAEPWMAHALDFAGEPRLREGTADMGANQLHAEGLTGPLTVAISSPGGFYYPNVLYTFQALIDGQPSSVRWDFGDGQELTNAAQASHSWPEGQFTLRLTASNATHSTETTLVLDVAPDTRYVSPSGTHAPPFLTWATAATNIQDAVDAVMTSGRVKVAAGTYACGGRAFGTETVTNRVLVTNSVEVIATDGPEVTFIVGAASAMPVTNGLGEGSVRGARLAAGAALVGFTVTNGHTRWSTTATSPDYTGGGIYCYDGSSVVSNCVVTGNAAAGQGGGVFQGTLLSSVLQRNAVCATGSNNGNGGGVSKAALVSNCVVRANASYGSGGGVYAYGGVVADSLIDGNAVVGTGVGGGYYTPNSDVIRRCAIVNNTCPGNGGGVYGAAVYDCLLTNNAAQNGGGYANNAAGILYRCRLANNRAASTGGGAYYGTLYSCVVSRNSADVRGGGTCYSTLENSTVTGNAAPSGGGTYGGTAYYSVIYYNREGSSPNYAATTSYGCCTTPYDVNYTYGAKTAAPQVTGLRDPHLLVGSPCLDGGDYKSWMTGAQGFDVDGEARYAGFTSDIGADERHPEFAEGVLSITVSADRTTIGTTYAPEFWAEADGRVLDMRWDFGEGTILDNQNPVRHAFAATGLYSVVVSVSNATHSASATQVVNVVAGDVYVSPAGGHHPPFSSWEHAATNLQDAVDAAVWGGVVWVGDGTYEAGGRSAAGGSLMNRVCIEKPVRVCGVNGPSGVIIEGSGAVRGVYLNHADSQLIGVTVTHGVAAAGENDGGGIYSAYLSAGGSNCVISSCSAGDEGGGVWGGSWIDCHIRDNDADWGGGGASSATLTGCVIDANTADEYGGGTYSCTLAGCQVSGNTALYSDGGGIASSDAVRCVLSANSAGSEGGGADEGTLESCLVLGNVAAWAGGISDATVDTCTAVENTATLDGGGVGWCEVVNSIVWHNAAPLSTNALYTGFRCSLTAPLPTGADDRGGNLDADPRFINASAGNYRLRATSPAVNAGTNEWYAAQEGAADLDGHTRVIGVSVDMGAYEYDAVEGYAALGTPYDWMDLYLLGPDYDVGELDDPDHDGMLTWQEYVALTCPTNGASVFAVLDVAVETNTVSVSFDTSVGRVYTVQRSLSLTSTAWDNASPPVAGTGGRVTVTVPDQEGAAFYRARVAVPQ